MAPFCICLFIMSIVGLNSEYMFREGLSHALCRRDPRVDLVVGKSDEQVFGLPTNEKHVGGPVSVARIEQRSAGTMEGAAYLRMPTFPHLWMTTMPYAILGKA